MKRAMILLAGVWAMGGCSSSSTGSAASASSSASATASSTTTSSGSTGHGASTGSSSGSTSGSTTAASSSGSTASSSSGSTATASSSSGSSGSTGVAVQVTTYTVPTGAALHPADPTKPGDAKPAGLLPLGGKVWAVLGNLDPTTFKPAGNSFLFSIDTTTSAGASHELIGCKNAQYLAAVGTDLIVTCTGTFNSAFTSNNDGSAVRFDTTTGQVTHSYATLGSPGAVAVQGNTALVVDALHNSFIAIDLATNAISVPAGSGSICSGSAYLAFVTAAAQGSSTLAVCGDPAGSNNAAELVGTDGGVQGSPVAVYANAVAAAPSQSTSAGDEYLVLAANGNAAGPTLQTVIGSGRMLTLTQRVVQLPAGSAPNDLAIFPPIAFVAGSGVDQVFRYDPVSSAVQVSAQGALPSGSDPARIAATDAKTAWVSLFNTNQVAKVVFP